MTLEHIGLVCEYEGSCTFTHVVRVMWYVSYGTCAATLHCESIFSLLLYSSTFFSGFTCIN